jgi:redox-sensitive bicupin YhaK (pirin superfamily)
MLSLCNSVIIHHRPKGQAAFAYIVSGSGSFGKVPVIGAEHDTMLFSQEGNSVTIETKEKSLRFVLLSAEPVEEKFYNSLTVSYVKHDGFVMTSELEIQEALMDYQLKEKGFENSSSWSFK